MTSLLRILLCVLVLSSGTPRAAPRSPSLAPADFPPSERGILEQEQRRVARLEASRALARDPDRADTLALVIAQERTADALTVFRNILARHPEELSRAAEILGNNGHRFQDQARGEPDQRDAAAADARAYLPKLPREEAAHAARYLLLLDPRPATTPGGDSLREHFTDLVREYPGTREALLVEVDLIARGRASAEQLDALDAFAHEHPGSIAAAKALYLEGFQLGVNIAVGHVERRGSDPTERFLRVLALSRELESGGYPPCEWVDKAPTLVTGFFASRPSFAPQNVDRMIAAYTEFVRTHFTLAEPDPVSSGAGYVITSKMADLFALKGDAIAGVERTLDALATGADRGPATYLKALYLMRTAQTTAQQRLDLLARARATLRTLHDSGSGMYQRRALATLAVLELDLREYETAVQDFTRYLTSYPDSSYAWVAALRLGQAQQAANDWAKAATAYRAAAARFHDVPLARVLGHEYAARALEAVGDFRPALEEHESALASWSADFGSDALLPARYGATRSPADRVEPAATVDSLRARIAQLRASLAQPGGALLEQGRWLVEHERQQEALVPLASLASRFSKSPAAPEGRYLAHRARFEIALALADVEKPDRDAAAAGRQFEALAREPYDDAICGAKIARATLLAMDHAAAADDLMRQALDECRTHGQLSTRSAPASDLEADVLAIRNAVFQPSGGSLYGRNWNAFDWPATLPPYLVVNPSVVVRQADGAETRLLLRDPFPGIDRVLFMTPDQIAMLNRIMTSLGGTKRYVPTAVMQTPNQPAGPSLDVLAFWKRFFPSRPGHWGGWELEAYPVIRRVEFLNPERTRAAVPVAIGYSGATVVLEKDGGVWRTRTLVNRWIT